MITAYYKFERLSDEERVANKVRSAVRLDCKKMAGQSISIEQLKNAKGQLAVYPSPCREVVKSNPKRRAEVCLTNGSNITSLFQDFSSSELFRYAWGDYANDGLLFLVNEDYTTIEMFVLPHTARIVQSQFDRFIDGGFDADIEHLRAEAKPFFEYLPRLF